ALDVEETVVAHGQVLRVEDLAVLLEWSALAGVAVEAMNHAIGANALPHIVANVDLLAQRVSGDAGEAIGALGLRSIGEVDGVERVPLVFQGHQPDGTEAEPVLRARVIVESGFIGEGCTGEPDQSAVAADRDGHHREVPLKKVGIAGYGNSALVEV